MKKDFSSWNKHKVLLDNTLDSDIVYFRKKEIWWCSLGVNIGHEQDGKNEHFERPVLIVKKTNRYLILGIPLSTKIKDHSYYFTYNFDDKQYSALLLQIRVMSSKRLLRRVGSLSGSEFQKIVTKIKNFI